MSRKTRKLSRKHRRHTVRRIPRRVKKGGADTQALTPPDSAFGSKIGAPVPSVSVDYKIA